MGKNNVIPEPVARWATTNVFDHYYPYLVYTQLMARELKLTMEMIHKAIEEESERRLKLIRAFYSFPPGSFDYVLGDIKDIEKSLDDWR